MNGNMYEITLDETWELFDAHLEGARSALACVLSQRRLDERSRNALNSSMAALGYGRGACTFCTLYGTEKNTSETCTDIVAKSIEPDSVPLDDHALFLMIEGLDPLCLILTDDAAAQACSRIYRCKLPPNKQGRAFGRTAVSFKSFAAMLDDGQDKQVAWALLKKLPSCKER